MGNVDGRSCFLLLARLWVNGLHLSAPSQGQQHKLSIRFKELGCTHDAEEAAVGSPPSPLSKGMEKCNKEPE